MYYFTVAAVTNYHEFSGLKTTQIDYLTVLKTGSLGCVSE